MDKYKELIKEIATIITDQAREIYLLKHDVEITQAHLLKAESKIAQYELERNTRESEELADA